MSPEFAPTAQAAVTVSNNMGLLILDPWRSVRVLTPTVSVRPWPQAPA